MGQSYRFKIGDFECTVVKDGEVTVPSEFLFGAAPEHALKEQLDAYGLEPDKVRCDYNCLVVDTGKHLVLIDTGLGGLAPMVPQGKDGAKLLQNLKGLDMKPEDFDTVIVTHYHSDHAGGISDEKGVPSFPNARYVFMEAEWSFARTVHEEIEKKLDHVKDQLWLLSGDTEIHPGIKAIAAPGHTPGHMVVSISSGGEELLYISDLIAHPIHLEFPGWSMSHEADQKRAAETRRFYLEKAAKERLLIHAFHLDFPGLGYIVPGEKGWRWKPVD